MDLEQKLKLYRISPAEYDLICQQLGREPEGVEWALYSALWSEHCSYKSSRVHLKKFYSQSERVVEGFGENAGVIDLGEGERVAFKMESHNHPSYIEPYQGAATGVGGILRDIFTMGARPVALANYLCFGQAQAERMEALVDGVIRGIGGYGNCVGVPNITGQTEFHPSYDGNILVNALALGLFEPKDKVFTSQAKGPGNYVVYVGAKTGRDGIHGASMASESFDEDSESKRPTVQIGDPFYEKLLIESCLEVMDRDLVVAIQDMGAAGLTSSSFEMSAKGGVGFRLELDKVPLRDPTMTPEDILLSESQERMLLICIPENFDAIKEVFERWNLDATVIGEVKSNPEIELYWHGEPICSVDPKLLVDNAPAYERPHKKWQSARLSDSAERTLPMIEDAKQALKQVLTSLPGTSREWVYQQYDQRVGARTARDCSDSVGVIALPSGRALGLVLGCRPYMMRFDAQIGAMDAILYPAVELAAKGFEPLAVTDCLNYGNPEKPELMTEFVASVEGMSAACKALNTPVISGNVSFYNETQDKNVTSTPSTGMVGLRPSLTNIPQSSFTHSGDTLYLVRCDQLHISGLIEELNGRDVWGQGQIDLEEMAAFTKHLCELGRHTGVHATRVVGKFGLAYTLARMSTESLGAKVQVGDWLRSKEKVSESLFAENYYEVVFTVAPDKAQEFKRLAQTEGVQVFELGQVQEGGFELTDKLSLSLSDIRKDYDNSWRRHFESLA